LVDAALEHELEALEILGPGLREQPAQHGLLALRQELDETGLSARQVRLAAAIEEQEGGQRQERLSALNGRRKLSGELAALRQPGQGDEEIRRAQRASEKLAILLHEIVLPSRRVQRLDQDAHHSGRSVLQVAQGFFDPRLPVQGLEAAHAALLVASRG